MTSVMMMKDVLGLTHRDRQTTLCGRKLEHPWKTHGEDMQSRHRKAPVSQQNCKATVLTTALL